MEWIRSIGKDLAEFTTILRDDTAAAAEKAGLSATLGPGASAAATADSNKGHDGDDTDRKATRTALERAKQEANKELDDLGWEDDEHVAASDEPVEALDEPVAASDEPVEALEEQLSTAVKAKADGSKAAPHETSSDTLT